MLGRLFSKLFGRHKGAAPAPSTSRPVSPPAPSFTASAPPPPPPPPAATPVAPAALGASAPSVVQAHEEDLEAVAVAAAPQDGGRVKLILEDGTLTSPSLDPELEERLRYIVDNIVPPAAAPPEGPTT